MSLVAKVFRVAAAVLNAAADAQDRSGGRTFGRRAPMSSADLRAARDAQRFDQQVARQAESARRTNLLIEMSQRMMQARERTVWNSLRSIDGACPNCNGRCSCR